MIVLGIESSCDETAAAIVNGHHILANEIATQHDIHEKFGGVVPELASRRHLENIIPVINSALSKAHLTFNDIDAIAVTYAPGLVGSLLVGISAAKGLAFSLNKPLIGVNHLEGHLNAALLHTGTIEYPYIGIVVSGGHTSLYLVKKMGDYTLLGATRDDAAGEAFDKVAKLMNLGYPGGPAIDKCAQSGDNKRFAFTKPRFSGKATHMPQAKPYDFSFSGIKTAVRNYVLDAKKTHSLDSQFVSDLAASFQSNTVNILTTHLIDAALRHKAKAIVISGGVAANNELREQVKNQAIKNNLLYYIPPISLCTDNAAMIAFVGHYYLSQGNSDDITLNAISTMEIGI